MSERFFVDRLITTDRVTLSGAEAHHLLHVMRAGVGSRVRLFDGSGVEFLAAVETLRRSSATLAILERTEIDRELPLPLTLAVALPKGDRSRWLVEKAVELGVTRLVPLETERSVKAMSAALARRLKRTVVEASKQCGRNRLLEIAAATRWPDFLQGDDVAASEKTDRVLAHPSGHGMAAQTGALAREHPRLAETLCAAVGPEGGWTAAEIDQAAQAGWRLVDLGPRILRTETAAMLLVASLTGQTTPYRRRPNE